MAVPSTNVRYTRIETEVNEAIQAHPSIHDELVRYSWSRYKNEDPTGGTYYEGLSHHSLCRTAIIYKGFIGVNDAFEHATHGGYSISDMRGYDWENHGTNITYSSADHFNGDLGGNPGTSVGDHELILTLGDGAFAVKSSGNQTGHIGPTRAHTEVQTDYSTAQQMHITVSNVREYSNQTYSGNGFTKTATNRFVVDLENTTYVTSVKARWRAKTYYASLSDNHGAVVAMIEKDDANPASYEYAQVETVAQNGLREGNRDEWVGTVRTITPTYLGYSDMWGTSDFAGQHFGTGSRCVSAFGVWQSGTDGNYDTAQISLRSGGYYEYQIRFYHDAATRDYTVLNIRAAYTGSSDTGKRLIRAKALKG